MQRSHKEKFTFSQRKLNLIYEKDKRYTKESLIKNLTKSKFVHLKESDEWTLPEGINTDKNTRILIGLLVQYDVLETEYHYQNRIRESQ